MKWNRIGRMLMLSVAALAILLACSAGSVPFLSQAEPTATKRPTRVARATFTPRPPPTETEIPEPTEEPTEVPPPTEEPTEPPPPTPIPVTKAPAPKPTNPPAPPTEPTAPPATPPPQFPYKASVVTCTHAGNAYIKGSVCADRGCSSKLSGMIVVMSDAPNGSILDKVKTDPSGDYTFTRSGDGPAPGRWFVWVVNDKDEPLSDAGGPIELDMGHNSDDLINKCPNTSAFVSFFKP